jgi:para-aminobenzoate synthetase
MKGTVKKSLAPSRAEAEALLDVEKERAENLMIVDLVRHDLYGVCGAGNVAVTRLMGVEEYESVWQMVTVVVGNIPGDEGNPVDGGATNMNGMLRAISRNGSEDGPQYSGVDVLAASLPPGSMTGAPKKRSCELLNEIEHGRRSLYSGVVGYMDVGGRGDWSVNIRCAFKWDDESRNESSQDTWYIGAGGAVTALSEDRAEREEMETKLFNTLNGFGLGLNLGRPQKPT